MGNRTQRIAGKGWIALIVLTMGLTACGGGDDPAAPTTAAAGGDAATTPTTAATAAPGETTGGIEDQTFTVGETFWHSGFLVEVTGGQIVSTENSLTGAVTTDLVLSASLENQADDTGFFGPDLAIATSNNSYPSSFASDIPDVPGGLKSQAEFLFRIDETFDLASAELVVGSGGDSKARIPLGDGGDAVRLEPAELAISGELAMELIDLTFTAATLRYDIPERHRQVEEGKQALTLFFDATSRKTGNWQIFAGDLVLILPDGTAIGADDVDIGSLPGSDQGTTTPDRSVRFLVDEMATGDFTVQLAPGSWFVGDDGVTEGTFDFALGG